MAVSPTTGSVQLSGTPPAWYRSDVAGPRVQVFESGNLVDDTAIVVEHGAVEGLAGGGEFGHVVGQKGAEEGLGVGATDVHHRHVGDVEHAGVLAHLVVLLHLGAVMQRHRPPPEVHDLRARRYVAVKKRRLLSHEDCSVEKDSRTIATLSAALCSA